MQVRFPIVGRTWLATTQEMAGLVLKDFQSFTMRKEGGGAPLPWWLPRIFGTLANTMLTFDEPDHTRLRQIVDEAFRRRAVLDMEPHILEIADGFAHDLFAQGSPADLVQRYARVVPLSVICELLGLPLADRPKFMLWASRFTNITGGLGVLRVIPALLAMKRYLEQHLEAARVTGGAGLIAELIRVEKEGGRISRDEMVGMVFLLLGAGSETTTHLISGSAYELLCNKPLREWLVQDWRRADLGVEEFLRFLSPVLISKPRFVGRDLELAASIWRGATGSWPCSPPLTETLPSTSMPRRWIWSGVQPAHRLRHRHPLLPRPSAGAHRGQVRPASPVHALAEPRAGRRARRSAGASGRACGRSPACRWQRAPARRFREAWRWAGRLRYKQAEQCRRTR